MAKKLAEVLDYPLIHLDNEFWKPGWVKTPREEWIEKQKEIMAGEKWIMDGNYDSTMEIRFIECDLIIFLDIKPIPCMISAIKRHGKKRSDLPDYLEEKFDREFFDFLKWIWNFSKTSKPKIMQLHHKYKDKPFIIIHNRREANRLIEATRSNSICT